MKSYQELLGNYYSAEEIIKAAEESHITIADYIHTAYLEQHGETGEQIDFDKIAEEITRDAGIIY